MAPFSWLDGLDGVAAVAAGAVLCAAGGAAHLAKKVRLDRVKLLPADQTGLSYTLSYVLAIPVYLFFLLIAYEATFLLIAKIGTMYASHAGARCLAVWLTTDSPSRSPMHLINRKSTAVTAAMAPFATTDPRHIRSEWNADRQAVYAIATEYAEAQRGYATKALSLPVARRRYAQTTATADSLRTRFSVAASRTTSLYTFQTVERERKVRNAEHQESTGDEKEWQVIEMTVSYKAPLRIPGPARWLDPDGGAPFEIEIVSKARMANEIPATKPDASGKRTLGIDYRSAARMMP
jgi:hypothetical protein